jgi:hypothetical protein
MASNDGYKPMVKGSNHILGGDSENTEVVIESDDLDTTEIMRAKFSRGIEILEIGSVGVERESIYGAAILLPQMARTLGWPTEFTMRALRVYVYLFVSICMVATLLSFLSKEEIIMDDFSGQPYLCDFGVGLGVEPGPGGVGPGGTNITAPRLYGFNSWHDRQFVAESLRAVFPDAGDKIDELVDPGEYGVESQVCRLLCVFVFMLSSVQELHLVMDMLLLLYHIPNKNEDWIELENAEFDSETHTWLEHFKIKVAGMSVFWKVMTMVTVWVPKMTLFMLTLSSGTTFLMEAESINDMIINATALSFVLNLDELMLSALQSPYLQHVLQSCEPYPLFAQEEKLTKGEALVKYEQTQQNKWYKRIKGLIPAKLLLVVFMAVTFIMTYYVRYCKWNGSRWISQDMKSQHSLHYSWLNALLPSLFPTQTEGPAWWKMRIHR